MSNNARLGILVSGRGSNLQSIMAAINAGTLNAKLAVVISDNPKAPALEKARAAGIPAVCIARSEYKGRDAFEDALAQCLLQHEASLVVLAGFMRILSSHFISGFRSRILNIHPALLPAFPGLHAQAQAIDYGAKVSGCTVHFVDEGMDTGPIILQAVVPIEEEDTEESLAQRILVEEHRIYPQAIQLYLSGCLKLEGRKVKVVKERNEKQQ
ncbi:phosphoribosylglycinamide formyltransferase [Azotosporobacter soli]|uniref:phosphoribosylglycinamide formyltransferase n=1 Tax=Azotosporobacter soli TaxID=3055040 RepID=UPI0031FE73E2